MIELAWFTFAHPDGTAQSAYAILNSQFFFIVDDPPQPIKVPIAEATYADGILNNV